MSRESRSMHAGRGGFTLIEVLFALAMVAVLAGSLFASLQIAFKAKKSAEASVVESRTVDIAMEFVRVAIQNAVPPNGVLAGNFVGDPVNATTTDLTFYSSCDSPQHVDGNGEIKLVELTLDTPDANGGSSGPDECLVQKSTRNLLAPTTMTPDEEVICRGVSTFSLRYFDGQNWQTSWDSTQESNVLPSAIEVTLQLQNNPKLFVRVFQIPCSTIVPGSTPDTAGGNS